MTQDRAQIEARRQLYQDIKDVAATSAGARFLAWWRRESRHGHAVLIPGDSHATHFYLGRQADINQVVQIAATPMAELLGPLEERLEQIEAGRVGAGFLGDPDRPDDFLYHHGKDTDDGKR